MEKPLNNEMGTGGCTGYDPKPLNPYVQGLETTLNPKPGAPGACTTKGKWGTAAESASIVYTDP